MKKVIASFLVVLAILAGMFGEYRYIMTHLEPYCDGCGVLHIAVFDLVDDYDVEFIESAEAH